MEAVWRDIDGYVGFYQVSSTGLVRSINRDDTDLEVNHKDGNRFNNRVENLEVVTHQQNIDHAVITNLKRDYGEKHVHAKLTNQQAEEMREMWHKGVKQVDIAKLFRVSNKLVHKVVNYKSYLR